MSGINFVGKRLEPTLNIKDLAFALPLDVANYYLKKIDKIMGSSKNEKKSQKLLQTMTMSKDTERSDAILQEKGSSFQKKEKSFSSRNKISLDEQSSRVILYSEASTGKAGGAGITPNTGKKDNKRPAKNTKNNN